ncbi:MAG: hypothetical protein IJ506_08215 [Clostridia bacterium]|nr:hypothetical protein [Clostridia bacterium]
MVIDVISFTDEQYAALSEEQILEVKSVQLKVNKLRAKAETLEAEMKFKLLENGVGRSSALAYYTARETGKIEQEIEALREGLLFYLRFSAKPESGGSDAPYTVDYSLTYEERFTIVKAYYETTYTNASERYTAFKADEVAVVYLGELYPGLHDYFKNQAGA